PTRHPMAEPLLMVLKMTSASPSSISKPSGTSKVRISSMSIRFTSRMYQMRRLWVSYGQRKRKSKLTTILVDNNDSRGGKRQQHREFKTTLRMKVS
ncbi:unnamed protein product, partial [Citrullus colocynthis]